MEKGITMSKTPLTLMVFVIAAVFFLSGCGEQALPPTPTPISRAAILSSIQAQGKLITVEMDLALVDIEVRDPALLGCTYTAQHVAKGVIEAGIDFSTIEENHIRYNFFGYPEKVTAPAPTIFSCRIDHFRQYDKSGGGTAKCFGNNWDAMSDIGRHLAMKLFVQGALESNILEQAQQQATLILKNQIHDLIGGQVEIAYEEAPQEPLIPSSCKINPPPNWEPRSDGGWKRTS